MEIKVDTKKDSSEDIKHAIDFLQKFITATSDSAISTGAFNLFDTDASSTQVIQQEEIKDQQEEPNDLDIKSMLQPY